MINAISAFTDNYIWAISNTNNNIFYCVDPGQAEPVLRFAQENKLVLGGILLTHHHFDHTGGVDELLSQFPSIPVYGPMDTRIPQINQVVKENDLINVGDNQFKILFNPGHTSSHISYYEPNQHWLFCGDTLFSGGCGRVFDGTLEELHQSINLFKKLPSVTKVFCAHEYTRSNLKFGQAVEPQNKAIASYLKKIEIQQAECTLPSTIELEHEINPFFRVDKKDIQNYALENGATSSDSLEVFRMLREQKNKAS